MELHALLILPILFISRSPIEPTVHLYCLFGTSVTWAWPTAPVLSFRHKKKKNMTHYGEREMWSLFAVLEAKISYHALAFSMSYSVVSIVVTVILTRDLFLILFQRAVLWWVIKAIGILCSCSSCKGRKVSFLLFSKITTYLSELWGLNQWNMSCRLFHLTTLRYMLGVPKSTHPTTFCWKMEIVCMMYWGHGQMLH